ncbi:MAG: ankyrin repeat domain-containing protein, partial [Bdellovibrionales bacterium]|nr:ankyrin repeat domain-containing protein [Bdellovibrionales bacterium]
GVELIDRDRAGWTALHFAVKRGMVETVRLLMEAGADPFLAGKAPKPVDLVVEWETADAAKASLLRSYLKPS